MSYESTIRRLESVVPKTMGEEADGGDEEPDDSPDGMQSVRLNVAKTRQQAALSQLRERKQELNEMAAMNVDYRGKVRAAEILNRQFSQQLDVLCQPLDDWDATDDRLRDMRVSRCHASLLELIVI